MVQCECIKLYHITNLNTSTWHHFVESMFEINFQTGQYLLRCKLNFQILKLDLRFQTNSNGFSRDRSFGHNFLFGYTIAPKNQLLMIKVGQLHIPNIKILGYFGKWVVQSKNFRFENSKFVLYFTC